MKEQEKRLKRCCFTGYIPKKISESKNVIKQKLEKAIRNTIADGLMFL